MSIRPISPLSYRSGMNRNAAQLLFPKRDWATAPRLEAPPARAPRVDRRIILCFDGTGNQFSETNSNVLQFFKCLQKDDHNQIVYYQTGIGTYTQPWLVTKPVVDLSMKLDAAIAWNLEHHVQDAYRFLMQNYEPGDKISFFGFSRGAYTARVLAGFVQKIGLLPRENHAQIPFAWNVFKDSDTLTGLHACAEYKKSFCLSVRIDFLGLWDTVAALGISGRELPFVLAAHNGGIRVFRHALALDERRAKFKPNFKLSVQQSDEDHLRNEKDVSPEKDKHEQADTSNEGGAAEVWFAGCHCDVGGGSVPNKTRNSLARIPLRWMIRECFRMKTGITFDENMLVDVGFGAVPFSASIKFYRRSLPNRINSDASPITMVSLIRLLWRIILGVIGWTWTLCKYLLLFCALPFWYAFYLIKHARFTKQSSFIKCIRAHVNSLSGRFHVQKLHPTHSHTDLEKQSIADDPPSNRTEDANDEHVVNEDEEDECDALSPIYDQLWRVRWLWWIFEVWPLVLRLQEGNRDELETQINWWRGREIYGDAWNQKPGEEKYINVHRSVFARMKEHPGSYRPRAWFRTQTGEFHWEADITQATKEGDLVKPGSGWECIRWVD